MEVSIKKPLFGKEVEFVIWDVDREIALPVIERAYEEALRLSRIFNFYDPTSEVSMLNKKRALAVSPELLQVLKLAIDMARQTKGQYDISLGRLFTQRKSGEKEIIPSCSYEDILIKGHEVTLAHPDILIDLGSIAKGYIVDKIVEYLKEEGIISGLVNGRGDIRAFGDHEEILGIQHPRDKEKLIARLRLKDAAVATSGDYNQYQKTFNTSHLINAKESISVTVIASTLVIADLYATALFVMGHNEREKMLSKEQKIKAFIIDKELHVHHYNTFEESLVP
jgi:thiamine biosynthesis lipoprotein